MIELPIAVLIILIAIAVALPAAQEGKANSLVGGIAIYTAFVYLSVETGDTFTQMLVYIVLPLSAVYAGFIAYNKVTGVSNNE